MCVQYNNQWYNLKLLVLLAVSCDFPKGNVSKTCGDCVGYDISVNIFQSLQYIP